MYPDPKKVKDQRITVRLDDYDDATLQRLSRITGQQLATLARELMMSEAQRVLADMESMQRLVA